MRQFQNVSYSTWQIPYNASTGSGTAYYANAGTPYHQPYKRLAMPTGHATYTYPLAPPAVDVNAEKKADNAGI
jgi:hypothetical protein